MWMWCHGAIYAYKESIKKNKDIVEKWKNMGNMKIALRCESEMQFFELYENAKKEDIVACIVQDAGHTQVAVG